jgi:hypothetical protein
LRGARGWQASDVKELQFSDVENSQSTLRACYLPQ